MSGYARKCETKKKPQKGAFLYGAGYPNRTDHLPLVQYPREKALDKAVALPNELIQHIFTMLIFLLRFNVKDFTHFCW